MLIFPIEDHAGPEGSEGLLALVIRYSSLDRHEEVKEGVQPLVLADQALQVMTVKYPKGHHIPSHIHIPITRTTNKVQEMLQVVKGWVRVHIYNSSQQYVCSKELGPHDIIVLLAGGHGFEMMDDAIMLEVRNGPYIPTEGKVRWNHGESK